MSTTTTKKEPAAKAATPTPEAAAESETVAKLSDEQQARRAAIQCACHMLSAGRGPFTAASLPPNRSVAEIIVVAEFILTGARPEKTSFREMVEILGGARHATLRSRV